MKKRSLMLSLLVGVLFAFVPSCVFAKEITVEEDQTIQAVVDAAEEGDVIVIPKGEYVGDVTIEKAITLQGSGKEATVIKGEVIVYADTTVQDLTISNKGYLDGGIKMFEAVELVVSNAIIQYDGYTEDDYGNSDYFTGIWMKISSSGSKVTVENTEFYAKYGIHVCGEENEVIIKNSTFTGFASVDISNGASVENGGSTTELAKNNRVTIEGSTLTGQTIAEGSNNHYGTIVIGGQKGLELLIDNSTVTNKITKANAQDLIRFGAPYLPSENVVIAITNSKLINTDTDNDSAVINFMTEENTLGGSMIVIEDTTEITSANDKVIEIYGETHLLTYSTVEGDVSIAVPDEFEITEDMLVVDEVEGYTFDGWYADEAYTTKFVAGTIITEDTTIYAKFTKITSEEKQPEEVVENVKTGDINLALISALAIISITGLVITSKKIVSKVK